MAINASELILVLKENLDNSKVLLEEEVDQSTIDSFDIKCSDLFII